MSYAKVIVNLALDKDFDYLIPQALEGKLEVGSQVIVPFGSSERRGYVIAFAERPVHRGEIKPITSVCGDESKIPSSLIELGKWMADYYCCSQEQAVRSLLPGAVRRGMVKPKTVTYYELGDKAEYDKVTGNPRLHSQIRVLKLIEKHRRLTLPALEALAGTGRSVIASLLKKGALNAVAETVGRDPYEGVEILPSRPLELNDEQSSALKRITVMMNDTAKKSRVLLLYGVTGSGKTEVYLQAIAKAIEEDKEAIVLVPEISLTPQTVSRFRERFGDMVSVLHSGLSDGERFDEWGKVSSGKVKIAVGARSALFAPFRKLGLIIVDEEHEHSYKQDKAPRYHARDVAVMRGLMEKAVVVLGSATPSFESYHNAITGKFEIERLSKRADDCLMPEIRVIDLKLESAREGKTHYFSQTLVTAVRDRLARGEQSIIFLNRRGYARQMLCEHCGFIAECPDCSVPYTYHKKKQILSCHLCGEHIPAYPKCPDCSAEDIRYSGAGTERLESTAAELFKGAVIARMDSDTMNTHDDYEKVLNSFKKGDIDILIGTQMIAKGLHFPNVTLVGVINADLSLHMPDFRAPERTFQLLTQVAGRAGRGEIKGEVIIQTFSPFNPAITAAVENDYEGFYEEEMEIRGQLGYPPEKHLMTVYLKGPDTDKLSDFSSKIMESLKTFISEDIIVSPPSPAPIERIKGKYRYMIIFRGNKLRRLRNALRQLLYTSKIPADIEVYVDVDAVNMM
ncbi:MAG: primosomal protein N' [Lentisphaerae bacterium GWF2_45_14]|nr:MAG: primosomal protein N' [Lentisphaerae bacterium GWF2_45_14]